MNKKGMHWQEVATIILVLVVIIAVILAFNSESRAEFKQLIGIRKQVEGYKLPDLGLPTIQKAEPIEEKKEPVVEKKPILPIEPSCKSFFDSLQSAVNFDKLSEMSDGELYYAINGRESFLDNNKDNVDCPREYITQIESGLVKLRAEKTRRGSSA